MTTIGLIGSGNIGSTVARLSIDAGYDVVAFTRQGRRRPPLGASRSVRLAQVPAPEKDLHACAASIEALVAEEQPVAVLPLDDAALLICDRIATAGGTGAVPVAAPVGSPTRVALDKREQLALAGAQLDAALAADRLPALDVEHEVAVREREVVGGNDAGAGHEERAVGEGVVAE